MPLSTDQLVFGPHLDVAAFSAAGVNRALAVENQDNYVLVDTAGNARFLLDQQPHHCTIAGWPRGHARVAVLDGMGGHGHGREAAQAVATGLLELPACTSVEQLSDYLDGLHARLQRHFGGYTATTGRPGTTLTLLELPPAQPALLYHVGDSRLYQLKADQAPSPLTVDHVPATVYALNGTLDNVDWWQQVHAEHRSQIAQAFILGHAFANTGYLCDPLFELTADNLPPFLAHLPDRRVLALDPTSVYVLATDGFWACPSPQRWIARWPGLLANQIGAEGKCRALFAALLEQAPPELHPDNLTAIVLCPMHATDMTALPGARH